MQVILDTVWLDILFVVELGGEPTTSYLWGRTVEFRIIPLALRLQKSSTMEICPSWSTTSMMSDSLTDLQTRTLNRIFEICQRPSNYVISVIARQMDLSETSVKTFFDDALRRHKNLKQQPPTFKMRLDFEWNLGVKEVERENQSTATATIWFKRFKLFLL